MSYLSNVMDGRPLLRTAAAVIRVLLCGTVRVAIFQLGGLWHALVNLLSVLADRNLTDPHFRMLR